MARRARSAISDCLVSKLNVAFNNVYMCVLGYKGVLGIFSSLVLFITRQSEMADLARRATRDLSQFHMGGPNFDTVRSWKL